MSTQRKLQLEALIIEELTKIGLSLEFREWDRWLWKEKEINFEDKKYLIGAYMRRDMQTQVIEIYGQECLLRE